MTLRSFHDNLARAMSTLIDCLGKENVKYEPDRRRIRLSVPGHRRPRIVPVITLNGSKFVNCGELADALSSYRSLIKGAI